MPSLADIVVVAVIVAAVVACVRWLIRSRCGCADCASAGTCASAYTGRCEVADDMVARAEAAVEDAGAAHQG